MAKAKILTDLESTETAANTHPVDSVNSKTGAVSLGAADVGAIPTSEKGVASGVASLDASGQVPASMLGNVAAGAQVATGTYTGNGATSRFIDLGFTPKVVHLINESHGTTIHTGYYTNTAGFKAWGTSSDVPTADYARPNPVTNGFNIGYNNAGTDTNFNGYTYRYVAIG